MLRQEDKMLVIGLHQLLKAFFPELVCYARRSCSLYDIFNQNAVAVPVECRGVVEATCLGAISNRSHW